MMGQDDRCGWLGDRCRVETIGPCDTWLRFARTIAWFGFLGTHAWSAAGRRQLKFRNPRVSRQKKQFARSIKSPRGELFDLQEQRGSNFEPASRLLSASHVSMDRNRCCSELCSWSRSHPGFSIS